jgi:hypothetical protein
MAYEINKTNGEVLVSIPDGEVDVSTSIRLVGKNYPGYGEIMAENLVNMLENFTNSAPPTNPIVGQIWYNSDEDQLYFFDKNYVWRVVESSYVGTQVKSMKIVDTSGIEHYAMVHYANFIPVMIVSSDSVYQPAVNTANTTAGITSQAFPSIGPGANMSQASRTDGDQYKVRGVAVSAQFS